MKMMLVAALLAVLPTYADEEIFLSCSVTQIAASEAEGKTDKKLRKLEKFLTKDAETQKFKSFRQLAKKSLNATKARAGKLKLRNGNTFSLRAVSVFRAQRKNNVTVEVSTDGGSDQKKFIDREYLLLNAGSLDKKSELVVAVSCPVFP
jgi:hypothetical protein